VAGLAALGAGIVLRLTGGPRWAPVAALVVSAAVVGVMAWWQRRPRPATDAVASRLDQDATLAGELRSALWFESREDQDAWTRFHVDRAAVRAGQVEWATVYPHARAPRQWLAAAVLAVATLALAVPMPASGPERSAVEGLTPEELAGLPPDVQARLAALMAQLDKSALGKDVEQVSVEELKDLLAKLDPTMQQKLTDLLEQLEKQAAQAGEKKPTDLDEDRAENSAAGMPEDVRWALEDLAARMAEASLDRQTEEKNPAASSETGEKGMGSSQAEQGQASLSEAASPLVREAASDDASQMMMGGGGPMGGDSRPGAGGNNGAQQGAAEMLLITEALKKELVEAAADALGENIDKEDRRKKTEHGNSALGFTRVAPPSAFDPSRATAPPPVPEARRQLLLHYFLRKQ
jgi:hypothetical protein